MQCYKASERPLYKPCYKGGREASVYAVLNGRGRCLYWLCYKVSGGVSIDIVTWLQEGFFIGNVIRGQVGISIGNVTSGDGGFCIGIVTRGREASL
jgi:hypothetical protein